ncbi:hypothetical protein ACP4OV_008647 [Aristida adscensionis]
MKVDGSGGGQEPPAGGSSSPGRHRRDPAAATHQVARPVWRRERRRHCVTDAAAPAAARGVPRRVPGARHRAGARRRPPHQRHPRADKIRPEDLHLSAKHEFFKQVTDNASAGSSSPERYPPITRTTIYRCTNFSVRSSLSTTTRAWTVFSKLLLGSLHVKSYDWTVPAAVDVFGSAAGDRRMRLARLVLDGELAAPCGALVLYPESGGNMHRLAAGATACAVLDVLGPEYAEDRDCTYYRDLPFSHHDPPPGEVAEMHITGEERRRLAWLEEMEKPEGLEMYEVPYTGRRIL